MTQEQALTELQAIYPAADLRLERIRSIGIRYGYENEFRLWSHPFECEGSTKRTCEILASSMTSWEHLIFMCQAKQLELAGMVDSPVEGEAGKLAALGVTA